MDQSELDALMEEEKKTKEGEETGDDDVQREPKEDGVDDVQDEPDKSEPTTSKREVSSVEFEEIEKGEIAKTPMDLDFILDIPLTVSVELGRGKMMISELLQLGQGSVIELMKIAGEPMEIFVNGKLIAMGEVVVINEKFGIRLTDVVSASERIAKLA